MLSQQRQEISHVEIDSVFVDTPGIIVFRI